MPLVLVDDTFTLEAINLFVRDTPLRSVDLDLVSRRLAACILRTLIYPIRPTLVVKWRQGDRDRLLLACAHHTATHRKYGNPLDCANRFGEALGIARLQ